VAGSHVTGVEVEWPTGSEPAELSPRGAFIAVYPDGVGVVPVRVSYDDRADATFEMKLPHA
jgi:hypothetical protein